MREYVVNRPEEDAMRRALTHIGPEVIVLRLAWQAGLSRDEISALTWEQVSFLDNRLELPDRMVPLDPDLRTALWRLYESNHELSPRVVLSSRGKSPLAPESISRLARQALDREGQTQVRLMDLRHDWILRQLGDKDWAEVSRISGVEVPALQVRFSAYLPGKKPPSHSTGGMWMNSNCGGCSRRSGAVPPVWRCGWRGSWDSRLTKSRNSPGIRWTLSETSCVCRTGRFPSPMPSGGCWRRLAAGGGPETLPRCC